MKFHPAGGGFNVLLFFLDFPALNQDIEIQKWALIRKESSGRGPQGARSGSMAPWLGEPLRSRQHVKLQGREGSLLSTWREWSSKERGSPAAYYLPLCFQSLEPDVGTVVVSGAEQDN